MNEESKKATDVCIDKYENMALQVYEGNWSDLRLGSENCRLCYIYNVRTICVGCPIMNKTGKILCHNTPYYRIADLMPGNRFEWGVDNPPVGLINAINDEIVFLNSLFKE